MSVALWIGIPFEIEFLLEENPGKQFCEIEEQLVNTFCFPSCPVKQLVADEYYEGSYPAGQFQYVDECDIGFFEKVKKELEEDLDYESKKSVESIIFGLLSKDLEDINKVINLLKSGEHLIMEWIY